MADAGEPHWNARTQRWETGNAPPPRFTPPPPPPPGSEPPTEPPTEPRVELAPRPHWQSVGMGPALGLPRLPWYRRGVVVVPVAAAVLLAGFGGWLLFSPADDGTPDAKRAADTAAPSTLSTPTDPTDAQPVPPPPTPSYTYPTEGATEGPAEGPTFTEGTEDPQETAASQGAPSGPPAGYQSFVESDFVIDVPEGWERRTERGQKGVTIYFYEEPGGGPRFVQVFPVTEEGYTPRKALSVTDETKGKETDSGYRRHSLRDVPGVSGPAAELDYSYTSKTWDTRIRVLDRVFPTADDTLYAVLSSGPATEWPTQRRVLSTVVDSFCLPSTSRATVCR
ncbi:hypothetical protein [Streptomyces apocyni]|uniref:hypothetical protein n=1 Tax=Streptomyces apocyni TaxID=2654677 RepID=UPI0012EA058D|nr:hypothetical protein [Streptomyces apocyni]